MEAVCTDEVSGHTVADQRSREGGGGGEGGTKKQWVFTDAAPGWGRRICVCVCVCRQFSNDYCNQTLRYGLVEHARARVCVCARAFERQL